MACPFRSLLRGLRAKLVATKDLKKDIENQSITVSTHSLIGRKICLFKPHLPYRPVLRQGCIVRESTPDKRVKKNDGRKSGAQNPETLHMEFGFRVRARVKY